MTLPHGLPATAPYETWRLERGTFFYVLCLVSISTGYYSYWLLWKLKAYLLGWVICLVLFFAMVVADHLRPRRIGRDVLPVLVWFGYLLASSLWSPSPATTLYFWGIDLMNLVAFLVSYAWVLSTSEWALSAYFEVQTLMILPIMLWFLVSVGQLYDTSFGAVRTGFATSCLVALPFLVWRLRLRPNIRTLSLLLFALVILVSGDSRSALLIAPVLLIGAFVFIGESGISRIRSITVLLALVIGFAMVAMLVPDLREAILHSAGRLTSGGPAGTSLSISSALYDEVALPAEARVDIERRLQLFIALQSFLAHPIIGGGFQSTLVTIHDQFGWEVSAHGLPSTLLGETGLLGTGIFGFMIWRFFRRMNQSRPLVATPERKGFIGTCKLTMLGILLLGLFHQVDQIPVTYVLLAFGYARGSPPQKL